MRLNRDRFVLIRHSTSFEMDQVLRIVITGGSGRVGQVASQHLASLGHDITNLDRRVPEETVGKFVYAELDQRQYLHVLFEGADVVIHMGEIPNAYEGIPPNELFSANTRVHASVVQTVAEMKIKRLVYVSTCQVYGFWGESNWSKKVLSPEKLPLDETQPLRPQNAYSASKVANESFSKSVSDHRGLGITVLRLPAVMTGHAGHWVRRWWDRASDNSEEGFWSYLHKLDCASAFEAAINSTQDGFEAYNIVSHDVIGNGSIRDRLIKFYPQFPHLPTDWPERAVPVSCAKAKAHFGWESKHSLEQDLQRLLEKI